MGVRSLGREDPLRKEMATHSSLLAWEIPWTEEPGGRQFMGSQSLTRLKRLSTLSLNQSEPPLGHRGGLHSTRWMEQAASARAGRLCITLVERLPLLALPAIQALFCWPCLFRQLPPTTVTK